VSAQDVREIGRHRRLDEDGMKERRSPQVLFEAWRGRYSDSPRAVSEALSEICADFRPTWVLNDATATPPGVRRVERYRARHLAALLTSDYLITTDIVTKPVARRPSSVYIQTWHGSPIKKVGLDETVAVYDGAQAHRRRMLRDVRRWDYLVSPSRRYTEIFRGAFGYEGDVLEIGNPRNDILVNDDGTRRRAVRDSLGLRPEDRVILYAPTWREDAGDGAGAFNQPTTVDWAALDSGLPDDVVILSRMHANVRPGGDSGGTSRERDVSGYGDVADLLLAADGLITDYSSIVHDFVVTGKPVYLHAPDVDRYRESVRELYVDYEAWAPGPISRDTDELVSNLLTHEVDPAARAAFLQEYCTFDDGGATQRLVTKILGSDRAIAS
jgi:CDP-glycerol glycerophosphotransferase